MTYRKGKGKRKETKGKARKRTQPARRKKTCSDVCDKTWESQGCPSGTCALRKRRARPGYKGYVSKKAYDEAHQKYYGL